MGVTVDQIQFVFLDVWVVVIVECGKKTCAADQYRNEELHQG
jgi:hypothetical protein